MHEFYSIRHDSISQMHTHVNIRGFSRLAGRRGGGAIRQTSSKSITVYGQNVTVKSIKVYGEKVRFKNSNVDQKNTV
jgi:hypothetical protein